MIELKQELQGSILDIGGGGEGVIGRLYGSQVVAIDNRQEELDETPAGFEKVLMDARHLTFANESFDHVTFFYSLMFMDTETQGQAMEQAVRVLKTGGKLHIWDAEIVTAYPEPFVVDLDIQLNSEQLHTTFGVISDLSNQSASSIGCLCTEAGLTLTEQSVEEGQFHLVFVKAAK